TTNTPVTPTSPATTGTLGSPGTAVIFGGSDLDYHTFSGGRFSLGFGLGHAPEADWGVEGTGFFVERRPVVFMASSTLPGFPVLARPIIDARFGTETIALISDPGVASGNVVATSHSNIYGWGVNLAPGFYRDGPLHI